MESLASSYDDLPPYLVPCFLYLGLFPLNSEICSKKLVKMWISEGFTFTHGREGLVAEDAAKEYLNELSDRSMLREATKRYDGSFKTYHLHSLFREICVYKARKHKFFEIVGDDETISSSGARRVAIYNTSGWHGSLAASSLRSIFSFPKCTVHLSRLPSRNFHLLRVLHLEGAQVHEKALPEKIGEAVLLRYLNLRDTGIEELPSSIGNLAMLQFLDLRGNHINPVPLEILRLTQLRELHLNADTNCMDGESLNVSSLTELHTLSIRTGSWMEDDLSKLSNLTNLRIYGDLSWCPNALQKHAQLRNLEFFRLGIGFGESVADLGWISPNSSLRRLELKRRLDKLQGNSLQNLTYLCLKWSQLKDDPMETLEKLQNLQVLRLRCRSFLGEKMVCSESGFRNLEILELAMLAELKEWKVEIMAMPKLRRLVISCCNRLEMLPQGLRYLKGLEEVEVAGMPRTFNDRLNPRNGADWNKIQQVKYVTVDDIQMEDFVTVDGDQIGAPAASADAAVASSSEEIQLE